MLVDRIRAHDARLTVSLGHLVAGHSYRLVISKATCGQPATTAKRIAKIDLGVADSAGAIFKSYYVGSANGGVWREASSVRLMEEEGIFYYFCEAPSRFDPPADFLDGTYARFQDGNRRGLSVPTGAGDDQISLKLALSGLQPNTRYRIVHSPLTCKQFLEGDPDQPLVLGRFKSDADGMAFRDRTESVGKDESITVGSNRIETVGSHAVWACANVHQFALLQ